MAISQKVSKPALSPQWQAAVTNLTGDGAAGAEGITLCSKAGVQAVSIPDGSYNGQMIAIIANGTGTKTVTPDSILGTGATFEVLAKACGLFVWYSDGTNEGWACVMGAAAAS